MAQETVVAESSAAAATPAALTEPKFTQFDGWDEEGTPVVTKKVESPKPDEAVTAAADASKVTKPEDAADSAAKNRQEKAPKNRTEARIKELLTRAEKAERELAEARKPATTTEAESSTAKPSDTKPAEIPPTRPKPTLQDKDATGKPKYPSFEDFNEDLVEWKVEQREARQAREQQNQQFFQEVGRKLEDARTRYSDYDEKARPVQQELMKPDISRAVFDVFNDSPVLPDLLYTIGGTEAIKADFLDACRNNPGKALRVALLMEQEIVKELAKGKGAAKKAGGGEGEPTPAKPEPRAPKPPTEVGGRGTPGEDARVSAAKSGDFRTFEAEETRRALASRR